MWVFSATFNKNYFSYLVAITFTDEKNRLQRKCLFFPEGTYIFYHIEFIEDCAFLINKISLGLAKLNLNASITHFFPLKEKFEDSTKANRKRTNKTRR